MWNEVSHTPQGRIHHLRPDSAWFSFATPRTIPAMNSCGRLLNSLHASGITAILVPGFDCNSLFVGLFLHSSGPRVEAAPGQLRSGTFASIAMQFAGVSIKPSYPGFNHGKPTNLTWAEHLRREFADYSSIWVCLFFGRPPTSKMAVFLLVCFKTQEKGLL